MRMRLRFVPKHLAWHFTTEHKNATLKARLHPRLCW